MEPWQRTIHATPRRSASALRHEGRERKPRSQARQHVICRAAEPFHADEYSAFHSPDKCVLEKDRKPCGGGCDLVYVLQLLPRAFHIARDPGNEKRTVRSCLDD